jgi:hypothetical protein
MSCGGFVVRLDGLSPTISSSQTPAIRSPTPIFLPPATTTGTLESTLTPTSKPVSTITETPLSDPTSTTTPVQKLVLEILDCITSIDLSHQMGEVTNAFPIVRNLGPMDTSNICVTLSANDESREHPDKTHCVPSLPTGYQIILKLTVDTEFQQDTLIDIRVTTDEGFIVEVTNQICREVLSSGWNPERIGVVQPIPLP